MWLIHAVIHIADNKQLYVRNKSGLKGVSYGTSLDYWGEVNGAV